MSAFDTPKETSRALSIFTKTVTIGFGLIAIMWGAIQYLFPNPIVYLSGILRIEYLFVFFSVFIFVLSSTLFIWSYLRHKVIFFVVSFFVYSLSCFAFFILGKEFYNPDLGKGVAYHTAEEGTLHFKGAEVDLRECTMRRDIVSCYISLKNDKHRQKMNTSRWTIVMEDGALFEEYDMYRGGQKIRSRDDIVLPTGVNAQLEVVFYNVSEKYDRILTLSFRLNDENMSFNQVSLRK